MPGPIKIFFEIYIETSWWFPYLHLMFVVVKKGAEIFEMSMIRVPYSAFSHLPGAESLNQCFCGSPVLLRVVAPCACAGGAELASRKAVTIQLQTPGLLAIAPFLPAKATHKL
jgi:hypothetical protein